MPSLTKHKKEELKGYQIYMAKKTKALSRLLLCVGMGMGKTVSVLTAVRKLLDEFRVRRVLVVAPKRVAKHTWPEEIADWSHLRCLNYSIVVGTPKQRLEALRADAEVYIINRENLPWLWKTLGASKWFFDMIVYDESSRLKSGKKRTKGGKKSGRKLSEFGALAAMSQHTERVVELTGTPAPNGLIDLWGQIYILDHGYRLGETKSKFLARWFDSDYMGYNFTPKPHAEQEIMDAIRDIMIGLREEDHIEVPKVVENIIYVDLPKNMMKEYKRFERSLVSEAYDVEAVSKGVLANKLLQFCIAEGTPVLTHEGWVPIERVTAGHLIWDGVEWVSCRGNAYVGIKAVTSCFSVEMTVDHKVLTVGGWAEAREVLNAGQSDRFNRQDVWIPNRFREGGGYGERKSSVVRSVYLREHSRSAKSVFAFEAPPLDQVVRLQARRARFSGAQWPRYDQYAPVGHLDVDEKALQKSEGQGLPQLRRSGYRYAGFLVQEFQRVLERCFSGLRRRFNDRPSRQRKELFQGQLSLDHPESANAEYAVQYSNKHPAGDYDFSRSRGNSRFEVRDCIQEVSQGRVRTGDFETRDVAVYDLIDCGPRHRFVVKGRDGRYLIVHNCNGSMYRMNEDVWPPVREIVHVHDEKMAALESVVEELNGAPLLLSYGYKFDLKRIKKRYPYVVTPDSDPDWKTKWDKGKLRILASQPQQISHGMNLQHGGCNICWYGLTWSLETWQQFNKRLARPGQKAPFTTIHQIVARDTAEMDVLEGLRDKDATQESITNAVRRRILEAS